MTLQTLILQCKNNNNYYIKFYSGSRVLKTYTFDDFYILSNSLACWLKDTKNINYKDRVIVKLGNSDISLLTYAALSLIGAVCIPVDPDSSESEISYIFDDSKSKLILEIDECNKTLIDSLSFQEVSQEVSEDDLAFIVYTSGTTSNPKGVMLSHKNIIANAVSITKHHKFATSTTLMSVLPLFHVNALNFSFIATLYSKSILILNRSFYLPNFWNIVSTEKVTVVSAVPKIIKLLLHDKRDIKLDLSSIKYFTSAAAPLNNEDAKSFFSRFHIKILQGYGMSEAVNFSLTMPCDISDDEYKFLLKDKILSVGIEIPNNKVSIMDENNNMLSEGKIGEVCIKGPNVMDGYLNKHEVTNKTIIDGWLHSGDRGYFKYINEQNFFYLVGRLKEIIIKNGENISPIELDNIITKEKGFENSAIVGFENEYSGEEIGIVIVKNDNTPKEEDILNVLVKILGDKKAPKAIIFTNEIPVTSTGKIQRLKLKEKFKEYQKTLF